MLETRKTFLLCVSVILLLLFGISGPSTASAQTRAEVAMSLHEAAWLNAAEQAEDDPAWKYAVYQSRTIAVKHPEIYMQADALFNELLTTAPNMGSYYRNRTQELFSQVAEYDKIARRWRKLQMVIVFHRGPQGRGIQGNIPHRCFPAFRRHPASLHGFCP